MDRKFTIEDTLYLIALIIALVFRTFLLGTNPMTDSEASLALRALELSKDQSVTAVGQPFYVLLTSGLFSLTSAHEYTARIVPAIFGSLFVLLAYLTRRWLGWLPGLVLAFIVAFDPGMLAVSRQAGGLPVAVVGMLLAAVMVLKGRSALAGLFSAVALLAGEHLWTGALALLAAWLWFRYSERRNIGENNLSALPKQNWKEFFLFLAGGLLVFGTFFLRVPSGIAGIGEGIITYLAGWASGGWTHLMDKIRVIIFYEPLLLIFTLIGLLVRPVRRAGIDRWAVRWLVVTAFFVFMNPSVSAKETVWLLLPMSLITSRTVTSLVERSSSNRAAVLSQTLMTFILIIFGWLNLAAIPFAQDPQVLSIRTIGLTGSLVLILLITILVMWGWSLRLALDGLLLGLMVSLAVFSLSAAVNAAGLGRHPSAEMWRLGGTFTEQYLLLDTLGDISEQTLGTRDGLDIVVAGVNAPSLRWSLRDFRNVTYLSDQEIQNDPSIAITPDGTELNLPSEYRGQDFILSQQPAWSLFLPTDWLKWLLTRDAIMEQVHIRAWVRLDLFPGTQSGME